MLFDTAQTGINTVVRTGMDLGLANSATSTSWRDQLQTASYKGIPFGVLGSDAHFGRRNALHEYPFRDSVWVEDLGRSARKVNVTGFLVENGAYGENQNAGQVIAQRTKLIAACEAAGDGELVHPTLGRMQVSLLGPVGITERWDHGRVFELSFSFIEAGQRIFPTTKSSTADEVGGKADAADAAAGQDFNKRVLSPLAAGAAAVNAAATTAASWYRKAQRLANDATNIANLAKSLPGELGRFALGARELADPLATIASLVSGNAASRQSLAASSSNLGSSASALSITTASSYGGAAQAVVAALQATSVNPADALRLLASLADFTPAALADTSQIGQAMNTMQSASADLFRRAAVVAMARVSATYQPSSQDDAVLVRSQVCTLLDNEITTAADNGDAASYSALRDVRASVVKDLAERGAALPSLTTVTSNVPMPALVLAMRLYRDPSRADDLIARAAPIHPAFMPTSFKALSS